MDKPYLLAALEAAKTEMARCMGGVDQAGCVAAAKRITELRGLLRDGAEMNAHLSVCLTTPLSVSARRKRISAASDR
jgi:hypothetical protein